MTTAVPLAGEVSYKVKTVSFKGRRVPIMLQDVNGPCPLLAIANVLLLRNQLQLPGGVGEVSQGRLVQMVAGLLLDSNSLQGQRQQALSADQAASLQHNLSDAIALLPKLTTGIDVNLRFHDTAGFEYTEETAVFDLLDIPLVHGWLVDPQDEPTARAVGSKSYNELVVQLVTALGSAAPTPNQMTPTASASASFRAQQHGGQVFTPRASGGGGGGAGGLPAICEAAPAPTAAGGSGAAQRIDAEALSAALRDSMRLTAWPQQQPPQSQQDASTGAAEGLRDSLRAVSNASMQTSDSMQSMVNRMLTDLVADAFASGATPSISRSSGQALRDDASGASPSPGGAGGGDNEDEGEGTECATSALRPRAGGSSGSLAGAGDGDGGLPLAPSGSLDWWAELNLWVDEGAGGEGQPVRVQLVMRPPGLPSPFESPSGSLGLDAARHALERASSSATPHPSAASLPTPPEEQAAAAAVAGASAAAAAPGAAAAAAGAPGGGPGDGSPREAAVQALLVQQFLEGHPSQLTYHGLAALQEGLRPNQLAVFFRNNHFNTLFKGPGDQLFLLATDEGFQFESDVVWEQLVSVDGDTQLVGGDFRPFQPHASQQEAVARQAAAQDAEWAAVASAAGGDSHDADLALAMQLQAEEEERVRLEQQRRAQQQARQQEEQRQQGQGLPSQRRPAGAPQGPPGSAPKKKKEKKPGDSCSIM